MVCKIVYKDGRNSGSILRNLHRNMISYCHSTGLPSWTTFSACHKMFVYQQPLCQRCHSGFFIIPERSCLPDMSSDVLILNNDYEPLNICDLKRAIRLICLGKVDVLRTNGRNIRTNQGSFHSPSVLRLRSQIHRPIPQIKFSRRGIFARDDYTCQYCGLVGKDLTIDHVTPKRMGGKDTWENLVCACKRCNTKKGDKTLVQSGMKLIKTPVKPRYIGYVSLNRRILDPRSRGWDEYLPVIDD